MTEVLRPERQQLYTKSALKRSSNSSTSLYLAHSPYPTRRQSHPASQLDEDDEDSGSISPTSTSSSSSSSSSQADYTPPSPAIFAKSKLGPAAKADLSVKPCMKDYAQQSFLELSQHLNSPPLSPTPEVEEPVNPSARSGESTPTNTPEALVPSIDDTAVQHQPSRHVDYLSHNWKEEEIWSSWRHIVSKRWYYGERSRLENASWRTWTKQKNKLKTISPDSLNWLKDCDVTWLYGPLQTPSRYAVSEPTSEPPSQLSKSNSFLHKKPILKKRSASEVMLQKSISASSLIKQAAAAVQAQQVMSGSRARRRPMMGRATSDLITSGLHSQPPSRASRVTGSFSSYTTSGLQTPDQSDKRHIRFDDTVEQCIALDTDGDGEEEERWSAIKDDDESSSDDGLTIRSSGKRRQPLSRTSSRGSFSGENKTIAKLPSTTLKDLAEAPEPSETPTHSLSIGGFWRPRLASPSPSQETLRPSYPSRNFLLEEDDDEADMSWTPPKSPSVENRQGSPSLYRNSASQEKLGDRTNRTAGDGTMRRTASGMFMPYEEEEESIITGGILGKMVDTVNTAKDIAHVIWNVGWRK